MNGSASDPTRTYAANGLNQATSTGGAMIGYDRRGNLTSSGGTAYGYDVLNRLVSVTPSGGTATGLAYGC